MPITLRNTKGSELTFAELDGNFTHLNTQIDTLTDSSAVKTFIDSSYVQGIAGQTYIESIVDSAYVNNRAEVSVALIDSDYVQARADTIKLFPYTVATAPASGTEGQMIYVTDGNAGNATLAVFSGGTFKVVSTIGATILDSDGGGGGGF
tara:strand:- start:33 stop:482 length:450 start_codon:yes stop_codon:yes gene_type:complete